MKPDAEQARAVLSDLDARTTKVADLLSLAKQAIAPLEKKAAGEPTNPPAGTSPSAGTDRLKFQRFGVQFFVDFIVVPKASDEPLVEGRIVYGALRLGVQEKDRQAKSLFECPVSEHGHIKDPSGLKGSWWLGKPKGNKSSDGRFEELHYLIVAQIWRDALRWAHKYPTSDRS